MNDLIPNLMLTPYDIALLIFCTIGAILGSVANIIMLIINPERAPSPGEYSLLEKNDALLRGMWIFLRVTLGGILGVVFALYFIGNISLVLFKRVFQLWVNWLLETIDNLTIRDTTITIRDTSHIS